MVYLPTFTLKNPPNVGKYTIHGSYGVWSTLQVIGITSKHSLKTGMFLGSGHTSSRWCLDVMMSTKTTRLGGSNWPPHCHLGVDIGQRYATTKKPRFFQASRKDSDP